MNGSWLVPFAGRNDSGVYKQNFLWKSGNLYVMDNHRAALWCWLQHMGWEQKVSICHIDKHTDVLGSQLDRWLKLLPADLSSIGIDGYLEHSYTDGIVPNNPIPLFRWDNYLSIFLAEYSRQIDLCAFATHGEGDRPNFPEAKFMNVDVLPQELDTLFSQPSQPWLINLDLDFFFHQPDGEHYKRRYSAAFAKEVFLRIKRLNETGNVRAITVALSPECCGGWANAERAAAQFFRAFDIEWRLPCGRLHGLIR